MMRSETEVVVEDERRRRKSHLGRVGDVHD